MSTDKKNQKADNNLLSEALLIIRNYKLWRYWRSIKKGIKTRDFKRGPGYYITVGLLGHNPIGCIQEFQMASGKIGLYELLDYRLYSDPDDMVKESWWHFLGYLGEKPVKDCSFSQFLSLYYKPKR